MIATCVINDPGFIFSAAHAGLHDGTYEPLHGHTFTVTVRVTGELDAYGMIIDFAAVKHTMRDLVRPLRRRVLLADRPAAGELRVIDRELHVTAPAKRYVFPADDTVLLPVPNTTTEAIAGFLLDGLLADIGDRPGLHRVELELAEAPDTSAVVTAELPGGRT